MDEAEAIAKNIDRGRVLTAQQYRQLLDDAENGAAGLLIAAVNAAVGDVAAAPALRVAVTDAAAGPVLMPAMSEEYVIGPDVEGVVVIITGQDDDLRDRKKRRAGGLPDGVDYDSNSFAGRVNFLPSQHMRTEVPAIGKRAATWHRLEQQQATDDVTVHEVRRVVPADAVLPTHEVIRLEIPNGTATLTTRDNHSFSGGKQLLRLRGLHEDLDGNYAVQQAAREPSSTLKINLGAAAAGRADELQQRVRQGAVTIREEHVVESSPILYHFMRKRLQEPPQQQQVHVQQQQPVAGADNLQPGFSLMPMPLFEAGQADNWPGGLLDPHAGPGLPDLSFLQTQQTQQQVPLQQQAQQASVVQGAVQPAASSLGPAGAGHGPDSGQQQAQPEAALPGPLEGQGSPQAARGHAQSEGHFPRLTVGGPEPLAGRGEHSGKVMMVQGSMEVEGELTVRGMDVLSDARVKEEVRIFGEAESAVAIAAQISTFLYKYQGTDAQRLGVMAQQVRAVLEQHGALGTNIVRQDAQGRLTVDYSGLQILVLEAVKKLAADYSNVLEAQSALQLTVVGRLEQLATAMRQWEASMASGAAAASEASSETAFGLPGGQPADGDEAVLEGLMDTEDVRMGSGSDGEEMGESEAGSGGGAAASTFDPAGELAGLSEEQAADWLLQRLGEQAGARKLYLNLASKLSRAALWQAYRQAVDGPAQPTAAGERARTPGGQFIKLAKQMASDEDLGRKVAGAGPAPTSLRGYQQRAVQLAARGSNLILTCPTGSGKTAIAIAHTEGMLRGDPTARSVFLAPTVPLVQQQTAVFLSWPSFRDGTFRATGRTSDNPVAPRDWQALLQDHHVVLLTPQLFLNMLEAGAAHMHQIALLVLDECHHAQADHSMARVMRHYHKSQRSTQVLGLTASPVSRASLDATYTDLLALQRTLNAQLCVLAEDDPELRAVVPDLQEHEIAVNPAEEDNVLARRLGAFVADAIDALTASLGLPGVASLPGDVRAMLAAGRWCSAAFTWTVAAAQDLRETAAANPAAPASSTTQDDASLGPASAAPAASAASPEPAAGALAAARRHDATAAVQLVRAAAAALALVSDVGFEAAVQYLSQEYYHVASKLMAGGSSGVAMPLTTELLQRLAQAAGQAEVLEGAYSLDAGLLTRHPKFAALRSLLLEHKEHTDFHAIVFARTREAVRSLRRMLAACPDLRWLEVHQFMGHGNRRAAGGGMSSKEQAAVMGLFRQPGARLLVSTAAGEEGMDVPRCELVVRYSATQTGRERLQSAGRARKLGSRFVELVERTPAELAAVAKSRQEVHNMREVLRGLGSMRI